MRVVKTLILTVAIFYLGFFLGQNQYKIAWKNYLPLSITPAQRIPTVQNLDMSLFYDVLDKINKTYYNKSKIDAKKMLYGAISGMLGSLEDPYTAFFPPKENESFKTQLLGEFSGIGAELGKSNDNRIAVISPLDSSPAEKAGIKSGDLILKVDGKDTAGWDLGKAVDNIRGKKGTEVALLILHEKQKDPLEIKIIRDTIRIKSVNSWVKNVACQNNSCSEQSDCKNCSSVAYLRISQFGDKTNEEWSEAVNNLYAKIKSAGNFKGIVLDLRNNPGGYLTDAVFIASEFLDHGAVVLEEDNTGERREMDVSRKGLLISYSVVILVNKGSASASEIVAGALRDHNRAEIIGDNTFGKGTVQEAADVDGGASVHLSVAKWLTPNGTWVNKVGIKPDVEVAFDASSSAVFKIGKFDNQLEKAIMELVK